MITNSNFLHLVNSNRDKYISYLNNNGFHDFANLVKEESAEAKKKFDKLIIQSSDDDILKNISNPFYIGMGNPDSKILIFGQELALDSNKNNPNSVLGFFQEQLYHHSLLLNPPTSNFDCNFNPYSANDFRKVTKHSYTWGIYSKWIAAFNDGDSSNYKNYLIPDTRKDKFENYCFYTELYHKPSPKHEQSETSNERMSLFESQLFINFFETFDIILIGCKSFYKDYENKVSSYFGIDKTKIVSSVEINYSNKKGILIKTESNQKIAIFNYQFSNAWSYLYLNDVSSKIKNL